MKIFFIWCVIKCHFHATCCGWAVPQNRHFLTKKAPLTLFSRARRLPAIPKTGYPGLNLSAFPGCFPNSSGICPEILSRTIADKGLQPHLSLFEAFRGHKVLQCRRLGGRGESAAELVRHETVGEKVKSIAFLGS